MHSIQENCGDSFAQASCLVGDKWSLQIIHTLSGGSASRFNGLQDKVSGICPRTLSARLDKLQDCGIIDKQVFAEVPTRVEYSLTPKGEALLPVIEALERWSAEYAAA
ncbi:helix-turn-helix transcriptional regulator [Candidatus Saccharibacteria bacterium]|nr:helix-turn-helix transcriptional regulator [Candidatus Saccharibacteria bacterium]